MKTLALILSLLALAGIAQDTEARRNAFVAQNVSVNIHALTPKGIESHKRIQSAYTVQVWVTSEDGSLRTEEQGFCYVAATDEYKLMHPVRRNYQATASSMQRVFAALQTYMATNTDGVTQWEPTVVFVTIADKRATVHRMYDAQDNFVCYWAAAEVGGNIVSKKMRVLQ